jgi:hypothetical protein
MELKQLGRKLETELKENERKLGEENERAKTAKSRKRSDYTPNTLFILSKITLKQKHSLKI